MSMPKAAIKVACFVAAAGSLCASLIMNDVPPENVTNNVVGSLYSQRGDNIEGKKFLVKDIEEKITYYVKIGQVIHIIKAKQEITKVQYVANQEEWPLRVSPFRTYKNIKGRQPR